MSGGRPRTAPLNPDCLLLLEQRQYVLGQRVRLGEHRDTSLLQDLPASQVGRFSCKVRILDSRTGSREVFRAFLEAGYH